MTSALRCSVSTVLAFGLAAVAAAQPLPPVGPIPPPDVVPISVPLPPPQPVPSVLAVTPPAAPPTVTPPPVLPSTLPTPRPTLPTSQPGGSRPLAPPPTAPMPRSVIPMKPGEPPAAGKSPKEEKAVTPPSASARPATGSAADAAPSQAGDESPKFEVVWNNGLFVQTREKDFLLHLGGTIQYDGAWYTATPGLEVFPGGVGRFEDGVNPRRIRLRVDGTAYKYVDYLLEVEFANAVSPAGLTVPVSPATVSYSPAPVDAWVTLTHVPWVGNVRVGLHKEPFSLENLNSSRFLPFIERSYLIDATQTTAFNNGRSPGVSVFRTWADDRVYTAVGGYKNVSNSLGYGVGDGEYAVTGRLGGLPVWDPGRQTFWFVGGAMSYRDPVDGEVRVRIRNLVRNAPSPLLNLVADTGPVRAASQTLFNLQTAAVVGPWTVQSEYLANLVDGASVGAGPRLGTVVYQGYYVEGLVFLTGESRTWNPKTMTFNRVIPRRDLAFADGCRAGGWGAWEVGVRYNFLDLTEGGVFGGRLRGATVGLNWYLNPNAKVQFNYDYVYRDESANALLKGNVHSFGTRLALDF